MSKEKNIRKIKCIGNCIQQNESTLHPITLELITNPKQEKYCPTNYYLKNDKINKTKLCHKDDHINQNNLIKFMSVPYVYLNPEDLLKFYQINSIDDLKEWFYSNIESKPFANTNRVINLWIKANLDSKDLDLKDYNNIFDKFFANLLLKENIVNKKYIEKDLHNFIDYWINKKNYDDFNFDLISDFKKFLSKKYGKYTTT